MKTYIKDGINIAEAPASRWAIEILDDEKSEMPANSANAGFFVPYDENGVDFTLPVGHLIADFDDVSDLAEKYMIERGTIEGNKWYFDSATWNFLNNFHGKAVSTLYISDGKAKVSETVNLEKCEYAVSGAPVVRNGKACVMDDLYKQGWTGSSLYATQHIFVGVKDGGDTLCVMHMTTKTKNLISTGEAAKKFLALGFEDVLKLDGGGSTRWQFGGTVKKMAEDRHIHSILRIKPNDDGSEEDMTIVDKVIRKAQSQEGVKESPSGSNKQKYGKEYGWDGVAWCVIFVWWVFKQIGRLDLFYGGKKTASCTTLMNYYKSKGQLGKTPKVGSLVFFNWGSGPIAKHMGIVKRVNSDGSYVTVEGNTAIGNDSNGGQVMERTRYLNQAIGFAYPYEGGEVKVTVSLPQLAKGSKGDSVKALQILLNGLGYNCGTADGDFGAKTLDAVKKFQKAKGLTADGIVGAKTWAALLG